jgi:hypothetical protein
VAVAESYDTWQQEQSSHRAKLDDLSLQKKTIRLKTVSRTFEMIQELVHAEDGSMDKQMDEIEQTV